MPPRFTSGYCSASTCTPTRYSLLTGTYAFRAPNTGIAPPNAAALIKPGTETIATILKRAGYATAVVGKWHLGLGDKEPDWNGDLKPGPLEIGFDRAYLLPTSNVCGNNRSEATRLLRQLVKEGRVEKRTSVRAFSSKGYWEVRAIPS